VFAQFHGKVRGHSGTPARGGSAGGMMIGGMEAHSGFEEEHGPFGIFGRGGDYFSLLDF